MEKPAKNEHKSKNTLPMSKEHYVGVWRDWEGWERPAFSVVAIVLLPESLGEKTGYKKGG